MTRVRLSIACRLRSADGFRRLQREAAGEDGEAAEEGLLLRGEEVVAPGDGVAHRLVAGGLVARAAGEQLQGATTVRLQALQAAPRGESMRSQGAANSIASGSPSRRAQISATVAAFSAVRAKVGVGGLGARGEERDRLVARQVRQRLVLGGSGSGSGGTGKSCSPVTRRTVRLVTSAFTPRAGAQQVGDVRRGVDDLLEVVEHQEQVLARSAAASCSGGGRSASSRRSRAWAIAETTRSGSRTAARETKTAPSANAASSSAATSIARRVLPTPPGPVSVTRRTSGSSQQVADGRDLPLPPDQRRERDGQRADAVAGRGGGHDAKAPESAVFRVVVGGNATRPGAVAQGASMRGRSLRPASAAAARSRSTRTRRRILPEGDFGIWSTNSTRRTFLYGATRAATNAISSSAVASPLSTTNAFGTSPASSSG